MELEGVQGAEVSFLSASVCHNVVVGPVYTEVLLYPEISRDVVVQLSEYPDNWKPVTPAAACWLCVYVDSC